MSEMATSTNRFNDRQPRLAEPAHLEASPGYLLARVGTDSRRRWARTLTECHVTPHHYSALVALDQAGAMSQQHLSRMVGIDPRNAVPVLDQLEQRGLVERNPDPGDRRRHAVTLTPSGKTLLSELRAAAEQEERQLLAPLSEDERNALHFLLIKLFTASFTRPIAS